MTYLAVETSAVTCSVACFDGETLTEQFVNNGLTHSSTLMELVDKTLKQAGLTVADIDAFLCNSGPGSFTGVRIGVATVKGLAAATEKPCGGLSTLHSMAACLPEDTRVTVCCLMDARRGQFYNALFSLQHGEVTRLTEDGAHAGEDIARRLKDCTKPVILMGDGAKAFTPFADAEGLVYTLPEGEKVYQKASGIIRLARMGKVTLGPPEQLLPGYLRKPQAQREREEREQKNQSC